MPSENQKYMFLILFVVWTSTIEWVFPQQNYFFNIKVKYKFIIWNMGRYSKRPKSYELIIQGRPNLFIT